MQYDFHLTTSAYIDVPNQAPEPASTPIISDPPVENKTTNSNISPHTGKLRASIPSVKFAPFPDEPSPRPSTVFISPAEKVKLLKEREERWDTLTPKKIRKLSVEGNAGVYELQEGIFLMCDDYVERGGMGVSSMRAGSVAEFLAYSIKSTFLDTLDSIAFELGSGFRGTYRTLQEYQAQVSCFRLDDGPDTRLDCR